MNVQKSRILEPIPQVDMLMKICPYPFLMDLIRIEERKLDVLRTTLSTNPKYAKVKEIVRGVGKQTDYCVITLDNFQSAQNSLESLPHHVVLDFGSINKDLLRSTAAIASIFIDRTHAVIDRYCILSSSIHKILGVDRQTNWSQERFGKKSYDRFLASINVNGSRIVYADYTLVSSDLYVEEVPGCGAIVQMKYTFPSRYFFARNGIYKYNYSIYDLCLKSVNDSEFDSEDCPANW